LTAARAKYCASQREVGIGLLVRPRNGVLGLDEHCLYSPEEFSIDELLKTALEPYLDRSEHPQAKDERIP